MTEQPIKQAISKEAERIEEDVIFSAKGHYNAADRWSGYHLWLGLPAALFGVVAGASAFKGCPVLAGILALLASALTVVLTFLKPSERSEIHRASASQYHARRNQTRIFREIDLPLASDLQVAAKTLKELAASRDLLNKESPGIPRSDFEKARQGIERDGEATHQVDQKSQSA